METYFDMLPQEIVDMIFELARLLEIEDDAKREQEEYWEWVREQEEGFDE